MSAAAPDLKSTGGPAASDGTFLDLRPARGRLSWRVDRLLPRPCQSLEHWRRYLHEDIPHLTTAERQAERWRIQVALAHLDPDPRRWAPEWLTERLRRLQVT